MDARPGWNPSTASLGPFLLDRATTSGPAADSATTMSPGAGAKTSADSSTTSCVWRPAPSGVSAFHFSKRTAALVSRTGTGEPFTGGTIQMESLCGSTGGAKRSNTTTSALTPGSYFEGSSNTAST